MPIKIAAHDAKIFRHSISRIAFYFLILSGCVSTTKPTAPLAPNQLEGALGAYPALAGEMREPICPLTCSYDPITNSCQCEDAAFGEVQASRTVENHYQEREQRWHWRTPECEKDSGSCDQKVEPECMEHGEMVPCNPHQVHECFKVCPGGFDYSKNCECLDDSLNRDDRPRVILGRGGNDFPF